MLSSSECRTHPRQHLACHQVGLLLDRVAHTGRLAKSRLHPDCFDRPEAHHSGAFGKNDDGERHEHDHAEDDPTGAQGRDRQCGLVVGGTERGEHVVVRAAWHGRAIIFMGAGEDVGSQLQSKVLHTATPLEQGASFQVSDMCTSD